MRRAPGVIHRWAHPKALRPGRRHRSLSQVRRPCRNREQRWSSAPQQQNPPRLMVGRRLLLIVLCSAAGATIALVAWYPGHWLIVLLALPLLWGRAPERWSAGALWVGYYLTGARDIPQMCACFFAGHGELPSSAALAMGAAFWLAQAALLTAPWVLLKPKADAPAHSILWRAAIALLAVSVPPIGMIGWLSALSVADVLRSAA